MAYDTVIYLVVKGTGQFDAEGNELVINVEAKLTRESAMKRAVELGNEYAVIKMKADKFT